MAYATGSGLQRDFWNRYYQRRAQKGAALSPSEMSSLYEPILDYDYRRAEATAERGRQQENFNRQMSLQEQAAKDAEKSATVSGIANLGGLAGNLYLGKRLLDVYSASKMAPTVAPALTAPGGSAPMLATKTAFDVPMLAPGAANVGPAAPTLESAYGGAQTALAPPAGGSTLTAPAYTESTVAAGEAAPAAAPSALAGAGSALTGAGAVYAGQIAGRKALEYVGVNPEYAKATPTSILGAPTKAVEKGVQSVTGSKGAGEAVGWIINPTGKGVSKATDILSGDTIICTELHRNGLLSDSLRRYARRYGASVDPRIYMGYLAAAAPVVERMRRSRRFTRFVRFFALPAIQEMAHRVDSQNSGNRFGSIVLDIGMAYCAFVYRKCNPVMVEA